MQKLEEYLEEHLKEVVDLHQWLFRNPEISGKEFETSKRIVEFLRDKGYEVEYPFAHQPTGFKATDGSKRKHKAALLVEYDALPDIGHACGHSLSASISILAGLILKNYQDELDTDIHLIGTPTEETVGAKVDMVREGVFDGYNFSMMVHLDNKNRTKVKLQALDSTLYTFKGRAAHASAAPWEGKNAFNGAQLMFHALDMLRQHMKPGCQIHGIIRHGGEAPNVVPEKVSLELYSRAYTRDTLDELNHLIDDCARGAAIATQTNWEKTPTANGFDNLRPNKKAEEILGEIFEELGLENQEDPNEIFGSSDAGNVSNICPTMHPTLKVVEDGVPIHTRAFAEAIGSPRAHGALKTGALMIAKTVKEVFKDEKTLQEVKDSFLNM